MKKAKIMLLSLAVIAIVGGVLAFKANKTYLHGYCYDTTVNNADETCRASFDILKPDVAGVAYYYTTQKVGGGAVTRIQDCPVIEGCPSEVLKRQ